MVSTSRPRHTRQSKKNSDSSEPNPFPYRSLQPITKDIEPRWQNVDRYAIETGLISFQKILDELKSKPKSTHTQNKIKNFIQDQDYYSFNSVIIEKPTKLKISALNQGIKISKDYKEIFECIKEILNLNHIPMGLNDENVKKLSPPIWERPHRISLFLKEGTKIIEMLEEWDNLNIEDYKIHWIRYCLKLIDKHLYCLKRFLNAKENFENLQRKSESQNEDNNEDYKDLYVYNKSNFELSKVKLERNRKKLIEDKLLIEECESLTIHITPRFTEELVNQFKIARENLEKIEDELELMSKVSDNESTKCLGD